MLTKYREYFYLSEPFSLWRSLSPVNLSAVYMGLSMPADSIGYACRFEQTDCLHIGPFIIPRPDNAHPFYPSLRMKLRDPHDSPLWHMLVTPLERAQTIQTDPSMLLWRLLWAKDMLRAEYRKRFTRRDQVFQIDSYRLLGDDDYALQWTLRERPDMPPSYDNQQTNLGKVALWKLLPDPKE